MNNLKGYNDLLKEIELWKIRLDDLLKERSIITRNMQSIPQAKLCSNYSGMPGSGMIVIDFPKAWKKVHEIEELIQECRDVLSLKLEAKRRMEKVMNEFDTLEYQVAYKRDIERKPLYKVAEELGYSYTYIREVSSRTKRVKEKIPS